MSKTLFFFLPFGFLLPSFFLFLFLFRLSPLLFFIFFFLRCLPLLFLLFKFFLHSFLRSANKRAHWYTINCLGIKKEFFSQHIRKRKCRLFGTSVKFYFNIDSHIFGNIRFFYCTKTIAAKTMLDPLPDKLWKRNPVLLEWVCHLHISSPSDNNFLR